MRNEIIDEVRDARAALAAEHGYDRQRIYKWAKATTAARKQAQRGTILKTLETTNVSPMTRKRRVRPSVV